MKRSATSTLYLAALLWMTAGLGCALDVPKLEHRVTDLAGLLTPEQVSALDAKLADLEKTDSTQVAVLIIPSLEGEVLEDYSERVATAWRLGQKGRDNGALLLVAMKERSVRIEVGYGLEPTLTDLRSHRIIQDELIPRFRQGDYYGGIDAAVTAIVQTVRGVYQGPAQAPESRRTGRGRSFDGLFVLLLPMFWILSATGKWGGGLLGAGAGMFLGYSLMGPVLAALLTGGALGGVAGMLLGGLIRAGTRSPNRRRWGGGFGGPFFGGGGFGGGGFGGGGFSGGGGSFGGGGSSGRW